MGDSWTFGMGVGEEVDSHAYLSRWRRGMAEVRRLERRLAERGVPPALFFTARWREPFAPRLVAEAGLESPYVVLPAVTAEVPSAAGGSRVEGVIGARGAAALLLALPLPADLEPGRAFEVVLLAERAPAGPRSPLGRSLRVAGIRQR